MDKLTKEDRSWNMSRIRAKNTKPEMLVRRLLHRAGFRFRIHNRKLPGNPDIVLPRFRTVIFVHGCYWHRHPGCREATIPRTNQDYWLPKFERTVQRDREAQQELLAHGWKVILLWECEIERANSDEMVAMLTEEIGRRGGLPAEQATGDRDLLAAEDGTKYEYGTNVH